MSLREIILQIFRTDDEATACRRLVYQIAPQLESNDHAVNLMDLANSLRIKITHIKEAKFEGRFSWHAGGEELITLTKGGNALRERFTLAHEIGHWMLRRVQNREYGERFRNSGVTSQPLREEERLANLIAAEILLPLRPFRAALTNEDITCSLVRDLGMKFKASRQAVLRRITDLSRTTLMHAVAVPNRFRDLASTAIIDSVMYLLPGDGLINDESRARFASRIPFQRLTQFNQLRLTIIGTHRRVNHRFSVDWSRKPIPHAELLAIGVVPTPIRAQEFDGALR